MSNKKVSQLDSALSIALLDLLLLTQVDGNAETGYTSKKITVSDLANKLNSDIQYATDLPDFSDKTITGALQELKDMLISQIPVITTSPAPIANFSTDLALPLKSCNIEIKPKQASGTPTPSNPLPISGTDTIIITQTGANLWDEELESGSINTSTGQNETYGTDRMRSANYIPVQPSTAYYFVSKNNTSCYAYCYRKDKSYIGIYGSGSNIRNATITTPSDCYFIRFRTDNNYGTTYANDFSLNYPSTDTTYHAYNQSSDTHTIVLGQTVYGGYLDLVSGVLTITHAGETINFSDKLSSTNLGDCSRVAFALQNAPQNINTDLCSVATYTYNYNLDSPHFYCVVTGGNNRLYLFIDNDDTVDTFQVCYKLATPVSIQLTPEEITALVGVNNVFGDSDGNTSVEYRESVQKYVDDNIAAVQALIL